MHYAFLWNAWNRGKVAKHGVTPDEAEYVVRNARPPYPRVIGEGKRLVLGQTSSGRYLQVIYVLRWDDLTLVIHARPLTSQEKRRFRRIRR